MTDLFLDIFNTSVSATWVVLAVVLARLLLKKAPRSLVCGLWSLVGLRLLIGGRLESALSMIPSAEIIPPRSLLDTAPAIDSGVEIIDRVVNPVYTESLRPMAGASVNPLQVWMAVFANLWILGMVAMALWALWSVWRVRRQVGESLCAGGNVYLCDRVESPFIFGFLRPKIYLPSGLEDAAKTHVIAHENAHIARRDHWWKPLGFLLLTVNWFNPAMWLAYILLCRDIEMACDERVVEGLTISDKKAYSSALLRCSVRARYVTACPLAFGEVGVKQRIKSVLNYKKPGFWIVAVTLTVAVVLGIGLLTSPVNRVSEIRYNGNLYVLFNSDYSYLPTEDPIGTVSSILLNTDEHPTKDFQATNLDEALAGCPLYLEEDRLYLQKQDGTCMAFRLVPSDDSQLEDPTGERSYFTADFGTFSMTMEIHDGWIAEAPQHDDRLVLRCHPAGKNDWMEILYIDNRDFIAFYASEEEPITLPNGATGTLFHSGNPKRWSEIVLDTTRGRLRIQPPNDALMFTDWKIEDYATALAMVGTLTLTENGTSLLGNSNPLGLTFHLENLTASSATLVCTQDGTPWDEITTGARWNLEQLTEEGWVSVIPDSTTWNAFGHTVNLNAETRWNLDWEAVVGALSPGCYRVSKTLTGIRRDQSDQNKILEETRQTVYAEFIIDQPKSARFSPELYQALQDDWAAYEAMSWEERMASSTTPGTCAREFDDWAAVQRFVGMEIANPLENLDSLQKGNWAAMPEGYNGASRFYVTFSGTRDGQVQYVTVNSGYRRDEMRVAVNAALYSDPSAYSADTEPVIAADDGEEYEARTAVLTRGSVQYTVRVMGDPGTGDGLMTLLEELLPYYKEIPTS